MTFSLLYRRWQSNLRAPQHSMMNMAIQPHVVVRYCPFGTKIHYIERHGVRLRPPLRLRLRLRITRSEERVAGSFEPLLSFLSPRITHPPSLFMLRGRERSVVNGGSKRGYKLNRIGSLEEILVVLYVGRKLRGQSPHGVPRSASTRRLGGGGLGRNDTLDPRTFATVQ